MFECERKNTGCFFQAKATKQQAIEWTSIMKPWELAPSGTANEDGYNLTNFLWAKDLATKAQYKKADSRPLFWEPLAKDWAMYCYKQLWKHPKCSPKKTNGGVLTQYTDSEVTDWFQQSPLHTAWATDRPMGRTSYGADTTGGTSLTVNALRSKTGHAS